MRSDTPMGSLMAVMVLSCVVYGIIRVVPSPFRKRTTQRLAQGTLRWRQSPFLDLAEGDHEAMVRRFIKQVGYTLYVGLITRLSNRALRWVNDGTLTPERASKIVNSFIHRVLISGNPDLVEAWKEMDLSEQWLVGQAGMIHYKLSDTSEVGPRLRADIVRRVSQQAPQGFPMGGPIAEA